MLTGPVTILAWSFVRDDQPLADTANQVALAIRDETADLESAGIARHPGRRARAARAAAAAATPTSRPTWTGRSVRSGWRRRVWRTRRRSTPTCATRSSVRSSARSPAWTPTSPSIEAARSQMEVLDDLNAIGFSSSVGPGVYDIHSPRVPSTDEIATSLRAALKAVPAERLWVNPDCGLKTRNTDEVNGVAAQPGRGDQGSPRRTRS